MSLPNNHKELYNIQRKRYNLISNSTTCDPEAYFESRSFYRNYVSKFQTK